MLNLRCLLDTQMEISKKVLDHTNRKVMTRKILEWYTLNIIYVLNRMRWPRVRTEKDRSIHDALLQYIKRNVIVEMWNNSDFPLEIFISEDHKLVVVGKILPTYEPPAVVTHTLMMDGPK